MEALWLILLQELNGRWNTISALKRLFDEHVKLFGGGKLISFGCGRVSKPNTTIIPILNI